MTTTCSKCGEELLGAVNRCWRCRQEFPVHSGPSDLPPVRRPPTDGPRDVSSQQADEIVVAELATSSQRIETPPTDGPVQSAPTVPAAPSSPDRPVNAASIASLIIGLVSVVLSFHTSWALPGCVIGLGLGIWGLCAPRRGPAVAGVMFCCIGLAISGFFAALDLYTWYRGVAPFDKTPAEIIEEPEDVDLLEDW